ncbi:MAG: iron uptake porin, partial [Cyanobacteria bacterium]|nr:iron uptake porin [Cyanobacteriota bacterium]
MTPAHAITSVDELSDINRNHWAFEALRDLVEKYDVIEGYPDHTFRGDRTPTRWEMAAALNALIRSVGKDLARIGAEKADKKDLATLARLQEEFRQELKVLTERVGALEARATAIEAKNVEQDNRLTLL